MWFEKLCQLGPRLWLLSRTKEDSNCCGSTNACFHISGIKVANGYHFLSRFIGSKELTKQFNDDKIDAWLVYVVSSSNSTSVVTIDPMQIWLARIDLCVSRTSVDHR